MGYTGGLARGDTLSVQGVVMLLGIQGCPMQWPRSKRTRFEQSTGTAMNIDSELFRRLDRPWSEGHYAQIEGLGFRIGNCRDCTIRQRAALLVGSLFVGMQNLSGGTIYLAEHSSGNPGDTTGSIYKFAPDGTRTTFASGLVQLPVGLALDGGGNLFVSSVPAVSANSLRTAPSHFSPLV